MIQPLTTNRIFLLLALLISRDVIARSITLEWEAIPRARSYEVEINSDDLAVRSASTPEPKMGVDLEPGVYSYRVRSVDRIGRSGEWSRPVTFAIRPPAPQVAESASIHPRMNLAVSSEIRLRWSPTPGSQSYIILVSKDGGPPEEVEVSGTEHVLKMQTPGNYEYKVLGLQKSGDRVWRGPASVGRSIEVVDQPDPRAKMKFGPGEAWLSVGHLPGMYRFFSPERNREGDAAVDVQVARLGFQTGSSDFGWDLRAGVSSYRIATQPRSAFDLGLLGQASAELGYLHEYPFRISMSFGPAVQQHVEVLPGSEGKIAALGPFGSMSLASEITDNSEVSLHLSAYLPMLLSAGRSTHDVHLNPQLAARFTHWLNRSWGFALEGSYENREISWTTSADSPVQEPGRLSLRAMGILGTVLFRWDE